VVVLRRGDLWFNRALGGTICAQAPTGHKKGHEFFGINQETHGLRKERCAREGEMRRGKVVGGVLLARDVLGEQ
jgi:hypothetical protein